MQLHRISRSRAMIPRSSASAPRGGGIAQRQALRAPRRQEAERLRLDGVRRPAERIRRLRRSQARSRSRSIRSMVDVAAPPPATIQLFGSFGSSGTIRAIGRRGERGQGRRAIAPAAHRRALSAAKSLRSSDFGGGSVKERQRQRPRDPGCHRPCLARRCGPRRSKRWLQPAEHMVVEQRVAGPGVAGDQRVGPSI